MFRQEIHSYMPHTEQQGEENLYERSSPLSQNRRFAVAVDKVSPTENSTQFYFHGGPVS